MMFFENSYEEITNSEANILIDIYEAIDSMVRNHQSVTLVGLGYILDIKPSELSDYLPQIITILTKIEEKYSIQ
jgi:hypothetical protein